MTTREAIEILKSHKEWRRGAEIPMADPKTLGIAIDTIVANSEEIMRERDAYYERLQELRGEILTWEDARSIVEIADEMIQTAHDRVKWEDKPEEAYYKEVLRKFKEKEK